MRILHPLDRYVLREFLKIFTVSAIGFPLLLIVIDLTDHIDTYLARNIDRKNIALSYLYWIPDSMFMVMPAAVLFATVFSVGAFTRHSEITAAKASGISFYRFVRPIFIGAVMAMGLNLALAEVVPVTNARRLELLEENQFRIDAQRYNFAYSAEYGRVYKAGTLDRVRGEMTDLQIERKGRGPDYPTYVLTARNAHYSDSVPGRAGWTLADGQMHVLPDSVSAVTLVYEKLIDRQLTEKPIDLTNKPRSAEEMRFGELGRLIAALERSGADANVLRVKRMLKLAIPVTCLIIALFGAPLATSTQRGGAAWGIGVSLVTTIVFLLLIQLTQAIGGKALIPPDYAAWIPNAIFLLLAMTLLVRVRT
jgi:lipopolysaccharide export system permease protein